MIVWQPAGKNNGNTTANQFESLGMNSNNATTEAPQQTSWRTAGTSSLFTIDVKGDDRAATTVRFRTGGANGNQLNTTTGGAARYVDITNSDTLAGAGELVNWALTIGAGGTSFLIVSFTTQISYTTPMVKLGMAAQPGNMTVASTTYFASNSYRVTWDSATAESFYQATMRSAGTIKNMFTYAQTFTWTGTVAMKSRKNTANGNLAITVSAAGAQQEDTVNSDTIVVTDLTNNAATTSTGSGTAAVVVAYEFQSSDNSFMHIGGSGLSGGFSFAGGGTDWRPAGHGIGQAVKSTAAEADFQTTPALAMTFTNMYFQTSTTNSLGSNATHTFRKNAANGNQTLTITTATSTVFEDTTNSDSINTTDKITLQTTGGTSGTATVAAQGVRVLYSTTAVKWQTMGKWAWKI